MSANSHLDISIRAFKLSGAGNSFIFVDLRRDSDQKKFQNLFTKNKRKEFAKRVCNPNHSFGADGLLFLENSRTADVKWDFYNSDGSNAEMCGNAARCVGRYLLTFPQDLSTKVSSNLFPQSFTLETAAGVVGLTVKDLTIKDSIDSSTVEAEMPVLREIQYEQKFSFKGKRLYYDFINSGVPHAVIKVDRVSSVKQLIAKSESLSLIAHSIRTLSKFRKRGVNVTFYSPNGRDSILSLTFERGVKDFTQACGTGAVAAATSFSKGKEKIVQVTVPGGKLKVDLTHNRPHLEGPAQFIGELYLY